MMMDVLTSKEKKCPKCGSKNVETTGGSHQLKGYQRRIGFKCGNCGVKFWMFESDYKP